MRIFRSSPVVRMIGTSWGKLGIGKHMIDAGRRIETISLKFEKRFRPPGGGFQTTAISMSSGLPQEHSTDRHSIVRKKGLQMLQPPAAPAPGPTRMISAIGRIADCGGRDAGCDGLTGRCMVARPSCELVLIGLYKRARPSKKRDCPHRIGGSMPLTIFRVRVIFYRPLPAIAVAS